MSLLQSLVCELLKLSLIHIDLCQFIYSHINTDDFFFKIHRLLSLLIKVLLTGQVQLTSAQTPLHLLRP